MPRWKKILAPVLVFFLGALCGGAVVTIVVVHRVRQAMETGSREAVRLGGRYVARELDLDAGQRAALDPILRDIERGLEDIRAESAPKFRALILDAAARMRPWLRPEQQRKLDELLARPRGRWERVAPERRPPPGGG